MTPAFASETEPCEICADPAARTHFSDGYPFYRCRACAFAFVPASLRAQLDTATIYDERYFTDGGVGYANYVAEEPLLRAHGRRYGEILNRHATPGTILDCGSAAGFLLSGYETQGWSGIGIEPNVGMAAYARHNVGVDVVPGRLEDAAYDARFDAVAMVQVIAHVIDLTQALERATRAVRGDGIVLVETWNVASATARAFGPAWHEWSPPSVLRVFSPRALERAFAPFGFVPIAHGRPKKFLRADHAKSLLAVKFDKLWPVVAPAARLLPDATCLPYPAEDLFYTIFRRKAATAAGYAKNDAVATAPRASIAAKVAASMSASATNVFDSV